MGDSLDLMQVDRFVAESNRIEGISDVRPGETLAARDFLALQEVTRDDLATVVRAFQHDAVLRDRKGLNVYVGRHIAPAGGPDVVQELDSILSDVNANAIHPWVAHQDYEYLHPFTDGNGRSGRLLWAWQMLRFGYRPGLALGFLHAFYYQTLEHGDRRA